MRGVKLWLGSLLAFLAIGAGPATAQTHKMVKPSELQFGPAPPGLPPAAQLAVLDGDPTKAGFYVVRLHFPDGTKLRPHWHSKDEHLTIVSGSFTMGMGEQWTPAEMHVLPPGGYMSLPAGERHYAQAKGDTVVQVEGQGPFDITYVNSADDPRTKRSSR
jgi:quercetin dioxygenase-like cupin family protein